MAVRGAVHPIFIRLDQRTRRLARTWIASAAGVVSSFRNKSREHGSTETTERYTHVTERGKQEIKRPLDGFKL